jgi:hypothetical protein
MSDPTGAKSIPEETVTSRWCKPTFAMKDISENYNSVKIYQKHNFFNLLFDSQQNLLPLFFGNMLNNICKAPFTLTH